MGAQETRVGLEQRPHHHLSLRRLVTLRSEQVAGNLLRLDRSISLQQEAVGSIPEFVQLVVARPAIGVIQH